MLGRCLLGGLLFARVALGAPLSEEDAVQRGLARPELRDLVEGEVDVARSEAIRSSLWSNPVLSYTREHTFGGDTATAEDYGTLTQSFDVAGKRRLRRRAGEHGVLAARLTGERRRCELASEIRLRFFETIAATRRLDASRRWLARLQVVLSTTVKRAAGGDASHYDRRRLERERATAEAQVRANEGARARGRARLAALMGEAELHGEPTGDLLPAPPPPIEDLLAGVPRRADLRALTEELEGARLERRAGQRAWVPELQLGGGVKRVETTREATTGFLATVSLPLPVFDHGRDLRLLGDGHRRKVEAEHSLALSSATAELRGLHAETATYVEAARRFVDAAVQPAPELVRTAEAGYSGGEFSILQLLDAYRSASTADEEEIHLALFARRARIELDRLAGVCP
jgi:outer membrane protein, heavy metal efflux system